MKKFIGLILSLAMIISTMAVPAFAASAPMGNQDNLHTATATPRAVVKPTEYAPNVWYDTYRQFTCDKYTYSSYIFDGAMTYSVDFTSPKKFHVEVCRPNGTVIETAYSSLSNGKYSAQVFPDEDFYLIIYNDSSSPITTADKAEYVVTS